MIASATSSRPSRSTDPSTRYRVVTKPPPDAATVEGQDKPSWPTVGVAFVNRGKDGREYIRVKLDDGAEGARELYLFVHEPKKGAEEGAQ